MSRYDYIIAGAGAAGLSLLVRMITSGKFNDKKILLLDKAPKTSNDRTWCFWEKKHGFFEEFVYRKWNQLWFHSESFSSQLEAGDYQYKMIRAIDFYKWCFKIIEEQQNIDVLYGDVRFEVTGNKTLLYINNEFTCTEGATIFNSIPARLPPNGRFLYLLQHFKGWFIETDKAAFDPKKATLMDFRVHQRNGTSFMYVLPLSENRALVEYTLFTKTILQADEYELELKNYVHSLTHGCKYKITEQEFGVIPMTNARFPFFENGIYHIGAAGGQTKPSTGYTFQFIQKQSEQIVECLVTGQDLRYLPPPSPRFHFYDTVLLQLLHEEKLTGREIFSRLFERNKAFQIFKFLDNETNLTEELRLISTMQFWPFLKAAVTPPAKA